MRHTARPGRRAQPVSFAPVPELPPAAGQPEPAERMPRLQRSSGVLGETAPLGRTAIEVVVTLERPLDLDPGHQVALAFDGFEPFVATPTLRIDGSTELNELVFHLRGDENDGAAQLADALRETDLRGRAVKAKGPVGRGSYRRGSGRLVLVAAETGFAAIWAIARAARYIEPARDIALVVGASDPLDLYMRPSLDWLRATGVERITLSADRARQRPPDVRPGPLTAHVPPLRATDVVFVSAHAATITAVEVLTAAVGARCYPIPLDPAV